MNSIPCLPDNAPFTPEQRAYLNGFLAGLFSRAPVTAGAPAPSPAAKSLQPLTILFGSQTGNAENLAKRIAKEAGRRGFAPTVHEMGAYPTTQLAAENSLLIVTSTFGDGDPPDNARAFWEFVRGENAPRLGQTRFSVCALGDSNYPKFCAFGRELDQRIETLGGRRVRARVDCDVDFEAPFQTWLDAALAELGAGAAAAPATPEASVPEAPRATSPAFSRNRPFPASMRTNRKLNGPGSAKEVRHFEFSLEGSGLNYEAGDACGVFPQNCPELVTEVLRALDARATEPVPGQDGQAVSLEEALVRHYDLINIPTPLLQALASRTQDSALTALASPGANGELTKFLRGREVIDLLLAYPSVMFAPAEFVGLLKKLQPRLYSISSSPRAHAGEVHLTVGIVRYESRGRARKGVCSTFLADRVAASAPVPVFIHSNKNFRPPAGGDTPMIMVGPGTGIAPFRAFLHERRATGAKGRNWVFFGDQCAASDFLYRDEFEAWQRDGLLARLDTAFSRDQAEKIYVQHRMREQARELFEWLEAGAHFYVCGDASRMARDVDEALGRVVEVGGGRTPAQASEYVDKLKSAKRYQRDVY
jgi:sulfite reductase (NADPH) flavoprotein alpha-component